MSNSNNPDIKLLFSHPAHFLSLGFGAGLLPKAPGTFGTLAAIPIYFVLANYCNSITYVAITLLVIFSGFYVCGVTEKAMGTHDHGSIVWDEIAGYLVTMLLVPVTWKTVIAGFILFRIFDIWKPFPISWLDKNLRGGIGTMMDDVVAGIFAWAGLQVMLKFFPALGT